MTSLRTFVLVGSVIVSNAAACGEPGVTYVAPVMAAPSPAASSAMEASRAGAKSMAGSNAPSTTGTGAPDSGTGDAGSSGNAAAPPCPSGFTCNDLGALGLVAMDQDGNEVIASCGNGNPTPCDEANPAASCPEFENPLCARVEVGGMAIVSCGQRCTP